MEIKLDLMEVVALQEVSKGRMPKGNTNDLLKFHLITPDYRITKAGLEILNNHTPVGTTRNSSLEYGQSRKIWSEIRFKPKQ